MQSRTKYGQNRINIDNIGQHICKLSSSSGWSKIETNSDYQFDDPMKFCIGQSAGLPCLASQSLMAHWSCRPLGVLAVGLLCWRFTEGTTNIGTSLVASLQASLLLLQASLLLLQASLPLHSPSSMIEETMWSWMRKRLVHLLRPVSVIGPGLDSLVSSSLWMKFMLRPVSVIGPGLDSLVSSSLWMKFIIMLQQGVLHWLGYLPGIGGREWKREQSQVGPSILVSLHQAVLH